MLLVESSALRGCTLQANFHDRASRMRTFAVLGSGGWGTALAIHLASSFGRTVRLWSARPATAGDLESHRENRRQLPGVRIPESVEITAEIGSAIRDADCWITAVPTAHLRNVLGRFRGLSVPGLPVVSLTKGIEHDTFQRPSEIIHELLGPVNAVALSGPSHAEEVARGRPTSLVAASSNAAAAESVQVAFGTPKFRIYTNQDIVGVELSGALKNVIGIAAGICDGLQFGDNAKAALLTRGLMEMRRFGMVYGAAPETFAGLAALGDLITTCFSPHGRNRRVGEELASGKATLDEIVMRPMVAEGVYTAESVYRRLQSTGIEMPIMTGVYQILYEGKSPKDAVLELLARTSRGETTFLNSE